MVLGWRVPFSFSLFTFPIPPSRGLSAPGRGASPECFSWFWAGAFLLLAVNYQVINELRFVVYAAQNLVGFVANSDGYQIFACAGRASRSRTLPTSLFLFCFHVFVLEDCYFTLWYLNGLTCFPLPGYSCSSHRYYFDCHIVI